jgi:hypothetical protein
MRAILPIRKRSRTMEEREATTGPTESPHDKAGDVKPQPVPVELGGWVGPDPTRYGDWEKNGRCIDF